MAASWGAATPFYTPDAVLDCGVRKARMIESDAAGEAGRRHLLGGPQAAAHDATDDRHLVLVNPSAGGGRTRDLLPRARGEPSVGTASRTACVMTTSLDHGVREARAAAADGEIPVVISGDGLIGQVGGVARGHRGAARA